MTASLLVMLAWSAGVAAATVALPGAPLAGAMALIAAAIASGLALLVRPAVIGLAAGAALLGIARAEIPSGDPTAAGRAPALAGTQARMVGVVADDPRPAASGAELLIAPQQLATAAGPQKPAGNVLVIVRRAVDAGLGDQVQVTGRLDLPRDTPTFDRRAYEAQRGVYLEIRGGSAVVVSHAGGPRAIPGWLRARYTQAIEQLLPAPHAQLLVGVVLGVRAGIPAALQQDLVATGLVHLLVLSGLKVALFARLAGAVLRPVLGRAATAPMLGLIILYALAGGATPAAVRASAMGGLALVAAHLGRPAHVWTSLAACAAAMLAWHPDLAWDVGFQLSFAGTAAIVLLTPAIERALGRLWWVPGWLREPFAVTCAAQVGTVALMANDFHLLSPVGPIANALVLPLLPALVAAGLLVAPLAAVPDLGRVVALPLVAALLYLERVASLLARLPAAALPIASFPAWSGAAYYAALAGGLGALGSRGAARRLALAGGVLVPLAIGSVQLVGWARPSPTAAILAVGEGQAVLLTGPEGAVLIDGGPSPAKLANELGMRLPPWNRRLAALVVTGPGLGHVGGLIGLAYAAETMIVPSGDPPGTEWRTAVRAQTARGARVQTGHAGERLTAAGFTLDVLSPAPNAPAFSQLALRVSREGGPSLCDFADLDPDGQDAAAGWLAGPCDTLLLPSAGRSAPSPVLMRAAAPRRLVASDAGAPLARGLPRGELRRTSQEGTIVLPM